MDSFNIAVVVPYFLPIANPNEYGLCRYLADRGHHVTLFASDRMAYRKTKNSGDKCYEAIHFNFDVVKIPAVFDIIENPFTPQLSGLLKKGGFDVIHAHEDIQLCSFLSATAAKSKDIPFIVSNERYYYPSGSLGLLSRAADKILTPYVRRSADMITVHANTAKEFLVRQGVDMDRIEVVPIGIDSQKFKPKGSTYLRNKFDFAEDDILLLSVARLHPYKGLSYLIEAVRSTVEQNEKIRLVISGRGTIEKQVRDLIKELELIEHVFIDTELIESEKMADLYSSCDIYVQPSIIEPFGLSVLEAMSCARPVIASCVGGMKDTVINGQTGFLVEPRNSRSMTDAIAILCDKGIREKMGSAARKRAEECFDWNVVGRKYLDLYVNLSAGTKSLGYCGN